MDKDRLKGMGKQAVGAAQQALGKVTGDTKTELEGAAKKSAGKLQNDIGGAKDAVRQAAGKR